jgi:predicted ATP-grasp superfamily ATP-dependent carboligase
MANDYEIFEGKSLSGLFKDIYKNTERNKTQLEVLMKEVTSFIKDGDTAVQIIPMLKEYLEINVKNDDQLVKMAAIVQRIMASEAKGGSDDEFGLSEAEKEQLLNAVEEVASDVQKHSDSLEGKSVFDS